MVHADAEDAETRSGQLDTEEAAEKNIAMMNAAVVAEIRAAHTRVFGYTCSFVIDDIANLEHAATAHVRKKTVRHTEGT